jgi:hypothetical protein
MDSKKVTILLKTIAIPTKFVNETSKGLVGRGDD